MTFAETSRRRQALRMLGAFSTYGMLAVLGTGGTGPALGADKKRRSSRGAALVVVDVENCPEHQGMPPNTKRPEVLPLVDKLWEMGNFDHVFIAEGSASFSNVQRHPEAFVPLMLALNDNVPWPSQCLHKSGGVAGSKSLAGCFRERHIESVVIASPVNAACVAAMAVDARKAGLRTYFVEDAATDPTNRHDESAKLGAQLEAQGVRRIRIADLPRI
ncbi:MAG: isochorismatase family protein [Gammaproteobacteria bacterium]|nr:isochorismatase family protein [Gammaproteobacteria bacterium]MBU1443632.1 isochorismatase family protein [Gammaproteobacteria bacterium]MBU2288490.1 isochorismatase family protein [Gammaproteobacteria bacterium]MBU2409054.1 isochorismatase family protein [Gammaproteobacteria bacterium]